MVLNNLKCTLSFYHSTDVVEATLDEIPKEAPSVATLLIHKAVLEIIQLIEACRTCLSPPFVLFMFYYAFDRLLLMIYIYVFTDFDRLSAVLLALSYQHQYGGSIGATW